MEAGRPWGGWYMGEMVRLDLTGWLQGGRRDRLHSRTTWIHL